MLGYMQVPDQTCPGCVLQDAGMKHLMLQIMPELRNMLPGQRDGQALPDLDSLTKALSTRSVDDMKEVMQLITKVQMGLMQVALEGPTESCTDVIERLLVPELVTLTKEQREMYGLIAFQWHIAAGVVAGAME